jgi:UDP-2,4-diacetamido-2,4,6-trideoxy-beta-L-altropyranose hydrolase
MKELAIFRCDASPEIGAGHAARCLALAEAFAESGTDILFATNREAPETFPALAKHRLEVVPPSLADEPAWLRKLAEDSHTSLVIDLPRASMNYESRCRSWAYKVAVIADFPDRKFDCDLIVDQTIGRMASEYTPLVPANCTPLTGAQYALVGKSFRTLRGEAQTRRKAAPAKHLLLAFGATDPFNYLGRLLPALVHAVPELKIAIAAGSRSLDDVRATVDSHADRLSVVRKAEDMPRAILEADLAVGLAGASAWERCVLGLPAALFIPSDYYRLATERLAATEAVAVIGGDDFDPAQASRKIAALAQDGAKLARMSTKAFEICDGNGAARVVEALR